MPLRLTKKFIELKEEVVQEVSPTNQRLYGSHPGHCCEKFRFEYGVAIN
ncbi:hypothetical protein Psal006b_01117 [Piscirickettsia salmonis]|uniref:Uncharacterized protein n=1 Tax=Piscirickettsia salmonis TaxID=1238 RepID=A0AAC8ZPG2_PISSA|nr:hypothetical protein KU39_2086 [Piscirickettsia salmonis]QGN98133.1 hypothetical protein Psal006b_01117 [Piscirickettsia salmonis]QGO01748.1 hypothetical protein Psal008_01129 [Piscirickettsia salmonis]QGO12445.1 hypothetical protein Psal010b_01118 [Piscirickettsia salmonis]QGO19479.1 hypothetical protein Psal013_01123 [Piscirickettsia salmonis]